MFVKVFINNVFFDLKDMESDKAMRLRTFPVLLGKKRTLNILEALNTGSLLMIALAVCMHIMPAYAIALSLTSLYVSAYLEKSRQAGDGELPKLAYVVADSEFLLWPVLLLAGKIGFGF